MNFTKGYKTVRDRISNGSKYTMSCYNCNYFYQDFDDTEEVCQNPEVLKYDMVVTPTNIYCNRWRITNRKESATFKGGESISGHKKIKIKKARK